MNQRILQKQNKMIDKINKQLQILEAQQRRFDRLNAAFGVQSHLFSSYVSAVKSVSTISNSIETIFVEALNTQQLISLFRISNHMINQLLNRLVQFHDKIQLFKNEKNMDSLKSKNLNCAVCGQNIHETNVKQAKIFLEQQSKQNFHIVMQQFKKIAEQPIFTKEQNNDYEQKLHQHLSQKYKVLNTNCNRIQEFTELMDGALSDLMKIKQIQINENRTSNIQFITANKISQDMSRFLQQSFSKKIPPWIHKMFEKMMTSYLEQCNQRKIQRGVQVNIVDTPQAKQIKQLTKQKKMLQRQNKELNDQLNQLKVCYKKLQEINTQHVNTISNMPRIIRQKNMQSNYNQNKENKSQSRKNSKLSPRSSTNQLNLKPVTPSNENNQQLKNYSILDDSANISGYNKRRKNNNILLPLIKRKKNNPVAQVIKQSLMADETNQNIEQEKNQQNTGRGTNRSNKNNSQINEVYRNSNSIEDKKSKQTTKQMVRQLTKDIGIKIKIPQNNNNKHMQKFNRKQQKKESITEKRNISHKKFNKSDKPIVKTKKQRENSVVQELKARQSQKLLRQMSNLQQKIDKKGQVQENQRNKKLKSINPHIGKQQSMQQKNHQSKSQSDSIQELYEYVSNIKLNKKASRSGNSEQQKSKQTEKQLQTILVKGQNEEIDEYSPQNLELKVKYSTNQGMDKQRVQSIKSSIQNYNKNEHQDQLNLLKMISQDLSKKINMKRLSLHNSLQIFQKQKRTANSSYCTGKTQNRMMKNLLKQNDQIKYKGQKYENANNNQNKNEVRVRYYQSCYEQKLNTQQNQEKYRNSENAAKNISSIQKLRSPKKTSRQESKKLVTYQKAQRQIFEILKNNNIIQNCTDYNLFSSLIQNVELSRNNCSAFKIKNDSFGQNSRCTVVSTDLRKQNNSQHKSFHVQDLPHQGLQLAHNSVYGRLFVNKGYAYKYQQSMTKSYHKKVIKQLSQIEHTYCLQMYNRLCETKKIDKQLYHQFCSILRYPYQTLYNNFQVINFMSDMSYETFEYFFKKIIRIHRKCLKNQNGVCEHIQSVYGQLKPSCNENN